MSFLMKSRILRKLFLARNSQTDLEKKVGANLAQHLDLFRFDLQYGSRQLRNNPTFAIIGILTLSIGIGANTAIFSLFDAIVLEALPVRDPSSLVLFSDTPEEGSQTSSSPPIGLWKRFNTDSYLFLKSQPLPFDSLCAFRSGETAVSIRTADEKQDAQVRRAVVHLVSGNYFAALGVNVSLGRILSDDDNFAAAQPVAVVSNGYWRQVLNSDQSVVGKIVILNDLVTTIVGVTPPGFFGERVRKAPDFWVPLVFQPHIEQRDSLLDRRDSYWLSLMGRLRHGVSRDEASSAATLALQQYLGNQAGTELTPEREQSTKRAYIRLYEGAGGISGLRLQYSRPLRMLLIVALMVLMIASANIGSLLITRALARRSEISVRLILGASNGRLLRQLLTEGILLAVAGAGTGILLSHWGTQGLLVLIHVGSTPVRPRLNPLVLAFTSLITIATGIFFGLVPAQHARKTDLVTALKVGEGRATAWGNTSIRRTLIIAQITVSLILLVGATLFSRSLLNLERQPLGFDQENVLLANIDPRIAGYKPTEVSSLYRRLLQRLSTLPGVRAATIARFSPFSRHVSTRNIEVEGYSPQPNETSTADDVLVGPDYPRTLGMALLQGREIDIQDNQGAREVAMVNEAFVHRFFGSQNPLGHHIRLRTQNYEIVGVLKNAHFIDAKKEIRLMVFRALLQDQTQDAMTAELEVRTIGDASAIASQVREAVLQEDSKLPITAMQTLHQQVQASFNEDRIATELVSAFCGIALILACVGLYGVTAQNVAQRTQEIGLRVALGARRLDVLATVLGEALLVFVGGLVLGLPLSYAASRVVSNQLYGVSPLSASSFIFAVVIMAVAMFLAAFLPALRATKLDPIVALRYE